MMFFRGRPASAIVCSLFLLTGLLAGCGGSDEAPGKPGTAEKGEKSASKGDRGRGGDQGRRSRRGPGGPGGFSGGGQGDGSRGVPVEVEPVGRQTISLFFETHGTLEAENEVDLVARVSGPVTELSSEEGRRVRKGEVLARIDDREIVAQLTVAKVRLDEAQQSYDRTKNLFEKELVSRDAFDQALAAFESARGDVERLEVQLAYTRIEAPFSGLVVQRYVKFAEHLQTGARLFRISDFDPLLCPIQVPERELARLRVGQRAELTVESFADHRFQAEVLRISPVVDSGSGTVKVTLNVAGEGKLRPGMFANVFLEMANRPDALVVPKAALALDSLGNTVFVANEGLAERRDLELGFQNDSHLEVLSGVQEGERVVVVGQDGLSDGTPIEILAAAGSAVQQAAMPDAGTDEPGAGPGRAAPAGMGDGGPAEGRGRGLRAGGPGEAGPGGGPGGRGGPFRNLDLDDPEQVERIKARMRERGMSDSEIDERLNRMRERRQRREGEGTP